MKPKIYIDGHEGTTGLRIHQILSERKDLELLRIEDAKRKDPAERKRLLNAADLAFLCLPDAALAVEADHAARCRQLRAPRSSDASTAFRTDPAWAYGIPELSAAHRAKLKTSTRIANPGCHATAFLLGVYPLLAQGILSKEAFLTCFSLTGYSGGGKKMIAAYEASKPPETAQGPTPLCPPTSLTSTCRRCKWWPASRTHPSSRPWSPIFMPASPSPPSSPPPPSRGPRPQSTSTQPSPAITPSL